MAAALSFERRRSRNFLVLTCIRKLAVSALLLTLRSQYVGFPVKSINVSDGPSRVHDPSDVRDKTMTNLLTTVVRGRKHRDDIMTGETEKSEAVAAWGRQSEPFTDIASGEATDEKSEDTCRRRECRRLEKDSDGTSSTGGEAGTKRK